MSALPAEITPFLGRGREMAAIRALLADPHCRLLTLVGPGGMGKTRLALAVARAEAPRFAAGALFVPLESAFTRDQLITAVASALGLRLNTAEDLARQLIQHLEPRQQLLVLDNFEQLVECADVLSEWLSAAPDLRVLVTSRERLLLLEEWTFDVPGLDLPGDDIAAGDSSAVQLFASVARRTSPGFDLDGQRPTVARVCRQLDGIPLAIELAAAGVRLMTLAEIELELARGLDVLATTARNMPRSHRCMATVFDQSWNRLDDHERSVFARLSVFAGGFLAEAAAEVAGASRADLARLLDTSWLRRDAQTGRYTIHELARQFGADHLPAAEAHGVRQRHAAACASFLAAQWPDLQGGRYREAYRAIEADLDNVRAAWRWAVEHVETESLGRALPALWFFFDSGSRFREGEALFAQAVVRVRAAAPPDAALLGRLLARQGALRYSLDDYATAEALLRESLELLPPDTPADRAFSELELGMTLLFSRDTDAEALVWMEAARASYAAAGDAWGTAYADYFLGITWAWRYAATRDAGALAQGETCVKASEAAFRALGNAWGLAGVYTALSNLADNQHDPRTAWEMAQRGRDLFAEIGVVWGISSALQMMAEAAWQLGWLDRVREVTLEGLRLELEFRLFNHALQLAQMAARLRGQAGDTLGALEILGAVDAERLRLGRPRDPVVLPLLDQLEEPRTPAQEAAIERGQARPFEDVLRELIAELAHRGPESTPNEEPPSTRSANEALDEPLTARELEILALLASGRSNRDIAETLVLSVGTIKAHVHHLTGKLGASNRTEAVAVARRLGLLDVPAQ